MYFRNAVFANSLMGIILFCTRTKNFFYAYKKNLHHEEKVAPYSNFCYDEIDEFRFVLFWTFEI